MTTQLRRPILSLVNGSQQPAIELDTARRYVKALGVSDDVLIAGWIEAARGFFEEQTGRQLITATFEIWLDRFPIGRDRIYLPRPPLQSVASVSYIGDDGELVSFDDAGSPATALWTYKAPAGEACDRGYVVPIYGNQWPIARVEPGAVRIRFTAGYGDAPQDVPSMVTGVLMYLVSEFETQRQPTDKPLAMPGGIRYLLDHFRFSALAPVGYAWQDPGWPSD